MDQETEKTDGFALIETEASVDTGEAKKAVSKKSAAKTATGAAGTATKKPAAKISTGTAGTAVKKPAAKTATGATGTAAKKPAAKTATGTAGTAVKKPAAKTATAKTVGDAMKEALLAGAIAAESINRDATQDFEINRAKVATAEKAAPEDKSTFTDAIQDQESRGASIADIDNTVMPITDIIEKPDKSAADIDNAVAPVQNSAGESAALTEAAATSHTAAEVQPAVGTAARNVTLKLIDLTKKFGERTSVDKVNLEVYEGEVFGFLGPNGAGKTTTIRMITGLASITSGEVLICGKSMKSDFRGALKNIGGIIENPEMYKYMSGWDNLKYYASLYDGITDARIMEVVKLVRMENRIHEKVKRYSLGMRQRVGIAQSLLHSPRLLLLDEPTNGLDPKGIHEMRDFLKMLAHEKGLSVFISSHILTEMQLMCDRVAIISQGKCIAIKSIDEWTQEGTTKKVKLSAPNSGKAADLIREKFNIEVQTNGNLLIFTIDDSKIADISLLLAAGNIPVLSLVVGEKSLEETFLELTSQDNMIIT